jgi:hypothetical protein
MIKYKTVKYKEINIEIYKHTKQAYKKVKPYMTYWIVRQNVELQGESLPYINMKKLFKNAKKDIDDWYSQFGVRTLK